MGLSIPALVRLDIRVEASLFCSNVDRYCPKEPWYSFELSYYLQKYINQNKGTIRKGQMALGVILVAHELTRFEFHGIFVW